MFGGLCPYYATVFGINFVIQTRCMCMEIKFLTILFGVVSDPLCHRCQYIKTVWDMKLCDNLFGHFPFDHWYTKRVTSNCVFQTISVDYFTMLLIYNRGSYWYSLCKWTGKKDRCCFKDISPSNPVLHCNMVWSLPFHFTPLHKLSWEAPKSCFLESWHRWGQGRGFTLEC